MKEDKNTAVLTVLGSDKVGIIAGVANLLAEYDINIINISQTIMDDLFTMIMLVELRNIELEKSDLSDRLKTLGNELGVKITIQHTGLFNAMHRI